MNKEKDCADAAGQGQKDEYPGPMRLKFSIWEQKQEKNTRRWEDCSYVDECGVQVRAYENV